MLHFPRIIPKGTKRLFHSNLTRKRKGRRSGDHFRVIRSRPRDTRTNRSGLPFPFTVLFVLGWVLCCFALIDIENYVATVFFIGLIVPLTMLVTDVFDSGSRISFEHRRNLLDEDAPGEDVAEPDVHPMAERRPLARMSLEPITDCDELHEPRVYEPVRASRMVLVPRPRGATHFAIVAVTVALWILVATMICQAVIVDATLGTMVSLPVLAFLVPGAVGVAVFVDGVQRERVRVLAED